MLFACSIPFSAVENPAFVRFCKLLRAGYKLPSRKLIGDNLLDTVNDNLEEDMKTAISGKTATYIEDGWSNIHNEPVIASCLQVEGKNYFLESYEAKAMTKSAENLVAKSKEMIKIAEEKYNCKVKTMVTDNAKNMENMRKALKEEDDSLVVYGCSAHWLNLLGQDVTPRSVMKHVVEIQKYFRNHHKPNAWLSECDNSRKPIIPGDTRWKSQLNSLDSYTHNRPHFMKIVQDHGDDMDKNIVKKIMDNSLFKNARDLAERLRPIAIALDICQSDSSSLADATHLWIKLASNDLLQTVAVKSAVQRRKKQALTPEHLVAYTIHPKYQGQLLNGDEMEIVNQWLMDKNPEFISTIIAYRAKSMPFPHSFFTESAIELHPVTWWKGVKSAEIPSEFIDIATQLLSAPCSSAAIERIFSNFSYIHSKIRNRLKPDKASKLVFCYRMLRGSKDLDY